MSIQTRVLRPTLDTPFHIDFDWWQAHDRNWHLFLRQLLCPEHRELLEREAPEDQTFDWVDPETAEVYRMEVAIPWWNACSVCSWPTATPR